MCVFPIEILENIARFLDPKSLYNLTNIEPEIKRIFDERKLWIVKFPPIIDWTSPDAPKEYKEYDIADFTIEFEGNTYRRSDGYWFIFKPKTLELIRQDKKFTLKLENMVIDRAYKKCLAIGKSQEEIDRDSVIEYLQRWPATYKKLQKVNIVSDSRLYDYFEEEYWDRTDFVNHPKKSTKKKPEKIHYDEDGDFSLVI